jgi:GDP-L-fucose synthase
MNKDSKIFVAGHRGLAGSAIVRNLTQKGFTNLLLKTRAELDLLDDQAVKNFFETEKPDYVFLAAAKVGGIIANRDHPAEFIYENLKIQNNVIHNAYVTGVKKLVFLGSVCIYPKYAEVPVKEEYLMTGALEPTNQAYAMAKLAGITMCQSYNKQYGTNFISAQPTNLYGPYDNFDLTSSHFLPALIRRTHEAKQRGDKNITLWGTGTPRREFLHSDDMADATVFLMENYNDSEIVNVGCGQDYTIMELTQLISKIVGFDGEILTDPSKPDGTPRRVLDVSKLAKLGWKSKIAIEDGIRTTYDWYLQNEVSKLS